MSEKRKKLLYQCNVIRQNATYTAETHHIISAKMDEQAKFLQMGPAIATAIIMTFVVSGGSLPVWLAWISLGSAIVSAVAAVIDPRTSYYNHLSAAKLFTLLKNEAQAVQETFSIALSDKELLMCVEKLQSKYDAIVLATPATNNDDFEVARERIKLGRHEIDKLKCA